MRGLWSVLAAAVLLSGATAESEAHPLRGSRAALELQVSKAREHDFTFLETPADVRRFVSLGYLVRVEGNENFRVHNVSFPYARPEVRMFIHRLAAQYRAACGQQLVVTSLTRPKSRQPPNASPLSVHPTGMALDLRLSRTPSCRSWLEGVLLSLEGEGVLDATRERWPPHYHIALFPRDYARYVERITGEAETKLASRSPEKSSSEKEPGLIADTDEKEPTVVADASGTVEVITHEVNRGDSLWKIARRYGVSVGSLREANGLSRSDLHPGQVIRVPVEAVSHTVGRGESLWQIAQRYGVSIRRLKQANGLSRSRIHPGQVLHIPVETVLAQQ